MLKTPPFVVCRELTSLVRDSAEDMDARLTFRSVDAWLTESAQAELLHRPSQRLQADVYARARGLLTKGSDARQRHSARAIAATLTARHSLDLAERYPMAAEPPSAAAPSPSQLVDQTALGRRIRTALSGNAVRG